MDSLNVSPKITTLGERFLAEETLVWLASVMSSEMVSQVARLLEYLLTSWVNALEILLISQCVWVININDSVPLVWNSFEEFLWALLTLQLHFLFNQNTNLRILFNDLIEII